MCNMLSVIQVKLVSLLWCQWYATVQSAAERTDGSLFVVGTLDGRLHGVEAHDGTLRWSVSTGGSMVSAFQNDTLFGGSLVVPSLTGSMFAYSQSEGGLARLPVSTQDLVGRSPFLSEDGTAYIGSKNTNMFVLDAVTGEIDSLFSSATSPEFSLRKLSAYAIEQTPSRDARMLVGRQDYNVRAVDSRSGALSWNASISTFTVESPILSKGNTEICELRGAGRGTLPRLVTTAGGTVHAIDVLGERLWTAHLAAPAVKAFALSFGMAEGSMAEGSFGHADSEPGRWVLCEVSEREVLASASSLENHYVDETSRQLDGEQFQFIGMQDRQIYARGDVLSPFPAGYENVVGNQALPIDAHPGGALQLYRKDLIPWEDGTLRWAEAPLCAREENLCPTCLFGIHPLRSPSAAVGKTIISTTQVGVDKGLSQSTAVATRASAVSSGPTTAAVVLSLPPPTLYPDGGEGVVPLRVVIEAPMLSTVRYTTNGSMPTCQAGLLAIAGHAFLLDSSVTVSAVTCTPAASASPIRTRRFLLRPPPPSFHPNGGEFVRRARVQISCPQTVESNPAFPVYSLEALSPTCQARNRTAELEVGTHRGNFSLVLDRAGSRFIVAACCMEGLERSSVVHSGQYRLRQPSQWEAAQLVWEQLIPCAQLAHSDPSSFVQNCVPDGATISSWQALALCGITVLSVVLAQQFRRRRERATQSLVSQDAAVMTVGYRALIKGRVNLRTRPLHLFRGSKEHDVVVEA